MNVSGERVLIFGDSLSHAGGDFDPEIFDLPPADGTIVNSSAPGYVLASILNNQGAAAVRIDANVGRSAHNFWAGGSSHQFQSGANLIANDQQFAPTKVIIMLGTNDADSGAIDADAMAAIRDSFPSANEILAIGPPIFADANLNAKVDQVYAMLGTVFSGNVIDARPLSSTDNRAGDGVHFQPQGASDLANNLAPAVLTVLSPGLLRILTWAGIGAAVLGLAGAAFWYWRRSNRPLGDHLVDQSAKFYTKKYGVSMDEARKLVQSPRRARIDREIDDWRNEHGYPEVGSPLVRGFARERIRTLASPFGSSAPSSKPMDERAIHENLVVAGDAIEEGKRDQAKKLMLEVQRNTRKHGTKLTPDEHALWEKLRLKLYDINPKRTFAQARQEILVDLPKHGWRGEPSLKIPWFESPDGKLRLWFKPQAVWITTAKPGERHAFRDARTLSYDLDIRKLNPSLFRRMVSRRYGVDVGGLDGGRSSTSTNMLQTIARESRSPEEFARRAEAWASTEAKPPTDKELAFAYWRASSALIRLGPLMKIIKDARKKRVAQARTRWQGLIAQPDDEAEYA